PADGLPIGPGPGGEPPIPARRRFPGVRQPRRPRRARRPFLEHEIPPRDGHTPGGGATNPVFRPDGPARMSGQTETADTQKTQVRRLPMTRRLILAALALFAFLALESCGVSRLAGPVNNDSRTFAATQFKNKKHE